VDVWCRSVGLPVVRNHIETLVVVATLSSVLYQCLVLKVVGEGRFPHTETLVPRESPDSNGMCV
jgi:hypothetical protein